MLYETIGQMENNIFTFNNQIPLGINSYKGYSKEKIITMPYSTYSGSWGIVGESGSGKSVLLKRIYAYTLGFYQRMYKRRRPGIILDMQSEDHHLARFPNSKPTSLFYQQGERVFGLDAIKNYAPVFVSNKSHPFDIPFGFSLDQFDTRDFSSLGMGAGAAKLLESLIDNNPDALKDLKSFYEALLDLPTNKVEFVRLSDDYPFKLKNYVNHASKQSLLEAFTYAFEDAVFLDLNDRRLKNDIIEEMKAGRILVINFHLADNYYSIYAGKILKEIYNARMKSKRAEDMGEPSSFPPPIIIVEEVHKLVPSMEGKSNYGSVYWLLEILKMGRKYDMFTMVATQEASSMSEKVRDNTRQWIIGKLVAKDYSFFSTFLSDDIMVALRNLDKAHHEFCIVYSNNTFDTFYAWDSPLELNRETKFIGGTR